MSRKNNLSRRKTQANFDKTREVELKAKQEEKRLRKAANREKRELSARAAAAAKAALAPSSGRVEKKKVVKVKRLSRLRKNDTMFGITVKDGDSKKAVLERLKAEQARELMET